MAAPKQHTATKEEVVTWGYESGGDFDEALRLCADMDNAIIPDEKSPEFKAIKRFFKQNFRGA